MVDNQTRAMTLAAAIILQQYALSSHLSMMAGFEDTDSTDEEGIGELDDQIETASEIMYLGSLVSVAAATLPPPNPTSRGPYNQFEKCTQFFGVSMGWPDRQFRHEYRSVIIFQNSTLPP